MPTLEQVIAEMIAYYIGRNDDPQGLASDLALHVAAAVDDPAELANTIAKELADCIRLDCEDV